MVTAPIPRVAHSTWYGPSHRVTRKINAHIRPSSHRPGRDRGGPGAIVEDGCTYWRGSMRRDMPRQTPLRLGDPGEIGGYRLVGRVAEGGQGVVYLGVTGTGGYVAVKLLRGDWL